MKNTMRDRIETVIKEKPLDRARIHEVSLLQYEDIIRRIEGRFVARGGPLHWAGIEGRFAAPLPCRKCCIEKDRLWYHRLAN